MRKIPLFLLLACASTLSGCGEESASNLPAVSNQPRVKLKALSPSLGEFPEAVALSEDGTTLYAGLIGSNKLVSFDSATLETKSSVSVPAPTGIIPDGKQGVLTTTAPWFRNQLVGGGATATEQGVWQISQSGLATIVATLPFDNNLPNALAKDAVGNLYVTNLIGDQIFKVDTSGQSSLWAQNSLYAGSASNDPTTATPGFSIGGNGAKIVGSNLFTSCTDFGRIIQTPILSDGSAGSPTIYVESPLLVGVDAFDMDEAGNVYAANLLSNQLLRVSPAGQVEVLAQADDGLSSPTGIVLNSRKSPTRIYFCNFSLPAFPFLKSTGKPAVGMLTL